MDNSLTAYLKDFLLVCVYPIIAFLAKKILNRAEEIEKSQQHQEVRLSVVESQVKYINDSIKELKDSIDKLPERIKSDLKDLIQNRRS